MQFIRADLKEDPPKYVVTLAESSKNVSEFFYLALNEEGLDTNLLQDKVHNVLSVLSLYVLGFSTKSYPRYLTTN